MNSNPKWSPEGSESDAALLSQLNQIASAIEPDLMFQAQLEAELRQTHRPKFSNAHSPNHFIRQLSRPMTFTLYTAIAIAAALGITTSPRWLPEWAVSALIETVNPQASAQTTADLVEAGQVIVRSDIQEFNEETQEVRAIGNAAFIYLDAQIEATADEIRYVPTERQIVLTGNVRILQRGQQLQGTAAVCSIEQKQCQLSPE